MTLSLLFLPLSFMLAAPQATAEVGPPAIDSVEITEWTVPWERSRPRDPFVAPDGRVWFVGQAGNYVGSLDAGTGEFRRYDLAPGVLPHNVVVSPAGEVWYAGNHAAHLGRLDPETGEVDTIEMPDPAAADPHTLAFDRRGRIWFTVQGGAFVGRADRATGDVRLVKMPPHSRPYGIVVDGDGSAWVALFGTNQLVTLDAATMEPRYHALPFDDARPRRLALTSDGAVWYVDHARGTLGRLDPATGDVREWATPGGNGSRPYAMAVDDADRLWLVETGAQPNRLVGFDPANGEFFSMTAIPSGGGTVRHMVYHAPTRALWFGTDTNTVGRAVVPGA